MGKMKDVKLSRCKVCHSVPRMVRVNLVDGSVDREYGLFRRDWWYQVECRGFHHCLTVQHKDKDSVGRLWNLFNIEES